MDVRSSSFRKWRVAAILKRTPSFLSFAELQYDPDRRLLRRGERSTTLSPREGMLATLFLERPEIVIKPEQILQRVWGEEPCELMNLRTHVHNLRRKIDAPGEVPFLHTIRGAGYLLSKDLR